MTPLGKLRLVVLISGGGTTLRNLIEKIAQGALQAEILRVISSSHRAAGLEIALAANISAEVVDPRDYASSEGFSEAIFARCREDRADLVVMGGFLKHVLIPADFENRVVNIHPALIPSFCGKGLYGLRVHEAVLASKAKQSGCTVHFVDNQYDHGPVILQKTVPVLPGDKPEILAARVFEAECLAYPEALRLIAEGRVQVIDDRVVIAGS